MKLKLLLLFLLFSATAYMARAGAPVTQNAIIELNKVEVVGGVIHAQTRKPISNVSVTAYCASKKEKIVHTDDNGNFSFSDLKPGMYRLVFEKEGFKKLVKENVMIRQDAGCQLNVELTETEEFHILPGQLFISDYN